MYTNETSIFSGVMLIVVIGVGFWYLGQSTAPKTDVTLDETGVVASPKTSEPGTAPPADDYIGQTEDEAEELAASKGVPFRVVERDGEMLPTTRDFLVGRINAVVEAGIVTSYTVEGNAEVEAPPATSPEEESDTAADGDSMPDGTGMHDAIIGMTVAAAEAYAEESAVSFRIGFLDGQALPVTMDYRPGRITANIDKGIVTSYSVE